MNANDIVKGIAEVLEARGVVLAHVEIGSLQSETSHVPLDDGDAAFAMRLVADRIMRDIAISGADGAVMVDRAELARLDLALANERMYSHRLHEAAQEVIDHLKGARRAAVADAPRVAGCSVCGIALRDGTSDARGRCTDCIAAADGKRCAKCGDVIERPVLGDDPLETCEACAASFDPSSVVAL